jgi:hypothetical protein
MGQERLRAVHIYERWGVGQAWEVRRQIFIRCVDAYLWFT